MSEMVERVAKAISGGDDPAGVLEIHRHRARKAIEAMREPTEEALGAAEKAIPDFAVEGFIGCYSQLPRRDGVKIVWQTMIDSALK